MVIALAFAAVGVWWLAAGDATGWLPGAFGGIGLLVFALQLVPGAAFLRLNEDGFAQRSLFRSTRLRWQDVAVFRTYSPAGGKTSKRVGFLLAAGSRTKATRLGRALVGVDGGIAVDCDLTAEELVGVLNAWKKFYSDQTETHLAGTHKRAGGRPLT